MPLEIISGEVAWSTLERNRIGRWPSPKVADRLYPWATPVANANFRIQRNEKIFCIGSCFARELENALSRLGFSVLSIIRNLPKSPNRKTSDAGMFNKYNVASIRNELRWVFDKESPYCHDRVLIETEGCLLEDYQLAGKNYPDEPHHAKAFREAFNRSFLLIEEADVVVFTLGLSEAWFDNETGLYLNATVPQKLVKRYPHRFELHVLNFNETLEMLEEIYALLREGLKRGFRLLITVSPVPLMATFRDQDVLLANTYSKAVLRSVVEQFSSGKANVDYFPSFEFVTLSDPRVVWDKRDLRHIDGLFVDHIMRSVMEQFCEHGAAVEDSQKPASKEKVHHGRFRAKPMALVTWLVDKIGLEMGRTFFSRLRLARLRVHRAVRDSSQFVKSWMSVDPRFSARNLLRGMQRIPKLRANKSFIGHLDEWDGQYLEGWASHVGDVWPIKVRVMLGERLVGEVTADIPRRDVAEVYGDGCLRSGFRIPLSLGKSQGGGQVRVVFADTGDDISNSPLIIGATIDMPVDSSA